MDQSLVVYSTVDGHTREISARIAAVLSALGHAVTQVSLDAAPDATPADFDRVVVGASIRYGKHRENVAEWINTHAAALAQRPGAFFSVNLVARKPDRDRVETNAYVQRFLQRIAWQPDGVAIFAGKLNYPRYGFWDRQVIRLIMLLTSGPTNSDAVVDYTDWDRVEGFARDVANLTRNPASP
jgi:menaquinone-dependent protoporphyrinogen oxidase